MRGLPSDPIVYIAKHYLEKESKDLTKLMQEKGVDVSNPKANKTPFMQALYWINLKTQNYIEALVNSEYVLTSSNEDDLGQNQRLSDIVPLPKKLKPVESLKFQPYPYQD